jgi:LDH2 family malate/lactate/ureidoglycolate dehydrogenase
MHMPKPNEQNTPRIAVETLEALCVKAMMHSGMSELDANTTARVLVTTDTWGVFSHGTKQLLHYLRKVHAGGIDPRAAPEIVKEGPSWAIIDGRCAMAMVSATLAMELAMRKAKANGIAYVGVRNSTHFGAAGYYASLAANQDMIGLAMSNVDINMTAPGARGSIIGNNPLAYAFPAGKEAPILLDIALSTVAAGKIYAAQALGKPIPDTWLIDAEGLPTTDISHYPHVGALLPMSGHKGYGLAILVEMLAAALTGAAITTEVKSWLLDLALPSNEGHAFVAIDVEVFVAIQEFKERVDRMIRNMHQSPKAKGADRIYLPGEIEWEKRREALEKGIELPEDVRSNLLTMAHEAGIDADGLG